MNNAVIKIVETTQEADDLDKLLWNGLWKPLGLPRNIRQTFNVDGEEVEIVAEKDGRIVGGLVAVRSARDELELRHLAVVPRFQGKGYGRVLVAELIRFAAPRGCRRVYTIARNTSAGFFRKLGFRKASGIAPEHPAFKSQGISFELLEKKIKTGGTLI